VDVDDKPLTFNHGNCAFPELFINQDDEADVVFIKPNVQELFK
jgi:hypothetical protein